MSSLECVVLRCSLTFFCLKVQKMLFFFFFLATGFLWWQRPEREKVLGYNRNGEKVGERGRFAPSALGNKESAWKDHLWPGQSLNRGSNCCWKSCDNVMIAPSADLPYAGISERLLIRRSQRIPKHKEEANLKFKATGCCLVVYCRLGTLCSCRGCRWGWQEE